MLSGKHLIVEVTDDHSDVKQLIQESPYDICSHPA